MSLRLFAFPFLSVISVLGTISPAFKGQVISGESAKPLVERILIPEHETNKNRKESIKSLFTKIPLANEVSPNDSEIKRLVKYHFEQQLLRAIIIINGVKIS